MLPINPQKLRYTTISYARYSKPMVQKYETRALDSGEPPLTRPGLETSDLRKKRFYTVIMLIIITAE